jgi:predicted glutamine amidotransferase
MATRTTFSLRAFAGHGTPGTVDGWGVALYDDRDVRLCHSVAGHASELRYGLQKG